MPKKELDRIPGEPNRTPYELWRVNSAGEQIERLGKYATLEELRAHKRRYDWRYAVYRDRKKISD